MSGIEVRANARISWPGATGPVDVAEKSWAWQREYRSLLADWFVRRHRRSIEMLDAKEIVRAITKRSKTTSDTHRDDAQAAIR